MKSKKSKKEPVHNELEEGTMPDENRQSTDPDDTAIKRPAAKWNGVSKVIKITHTKDSCKAAYVE